MRLFNVHIRLSSYEYENTLVAASDEEAARNLFSFLSYKSVVDVHEIDQVDGYKVTLDPFEVVECSDVDIQKESSSTIDNYEQLLDELKVLTKAKNSDYGGAVDITYLMFGNVSQLIRLWDKLLRLTRLYLKESAEVKDETVIDTLADLANYALLALAQRKTYPAAPDSASLREALGNFLSLREEE